MIALTDVAPTVRRRAPIAWLLWTAILAATTGALVAGRGVLDKAQVSLVLLLVVLFGTASAGRALGLWLAALSFLAFNWFFLPPYGTLIIRDPLDWLVLVVYLVTSIVAAQLLARARERAAEAEALGVERARLVAEAEHAKALREADRLKDALLASVSHDLRTPLTTIKALAHDLGALGDERAEIIEHEADRLNRLVADLLDLSRLSGGALTLRIEVNALDELLGALVQQVEPALGGRRLDVTLPPDDPLILARFDLVHSLRALVNLVENAAKYSPPGAPVSVSARVDGEMLRIDVADRGPGVPMSEVEHIFAPFHRIPEVGPSVDGAGLGLSIARGLAEAQGGTLTCAPRAGGGSVFTLSLPVAAGVE